MSTNRDIWVNRCRLKISSRFALAQAAVLRWEQLLRGARPRLTTENPKWMETPLREIATDAVTFDEEEFAVKLEGTPYEPPRPEPEDELDDLLDIDLKRPDAELGKKDDLIAEASAQPDTVVTAVVKEPVADAVDDAKTKAVDDAETKAKDDAEIKAKDDAETKAKDDAETKAKDDAETKAKVDADADADADADNDPSADADGDEEKMKTQTGDAA